MKLIHTTTDQINGGRSEYYLCESIEEFNEKVAEYKARKDKFPWEHINTDANIYCEPTTIVSDGFATRGGKVIKAKGLCSWELVGLRGANSTYIINPTTIEKMDSVKTENWWV